MHNISAESKVKLMCVLKRGNRYFYPKTIPRDRDSMTNTHILLLAIIYLCHNILTANPSLYASVFLFYLFINLIYRSILVLYELEHKSARYGNDLLKILQAAFYLNSITVIFAIISTIYLVYYITKYGLPKFQDENLYLMIPFLFVFHLLLDLDDYPLNNSLTIFNSKNLDYGSGMAFSYFYGYLKLMLEKVGQPNVNLKEMMQNYENSQHIKFVAYKIFILIPKSLKCFESIQDCSRIVEMKKTLMEKLITVAGVRDRVYKHSVYGIQTGTKQVYVCGEYASPLKTLKDVLDHNRGVTESFSRHRNDILSQFYLTMVHLLEENKSESMCELIYYDDMDANRAYYDVGKVLLSRIMTNENRKEQ